VDEQVFVGKPERKAKLGRPIYRLEDDIKMVLKGVMCYVM